MQHPHGRQACQILEDACEFGKIHVQPAPKTVYGGIELSLLGPTSHPEFAKVGIDSFLSQIPKVVSVTYELRYDVCIFAIVFCWAVIEKLFLAFDVHGIYQDNGDIELFWLMKQYQLNGLP